MNQDKLKTLQDYVQRLEQIIDDQDLLTLELQQILREAEAAKFDQDGLIQVLECRINGLAANLVSNRAGVSYLHALGDLEPESKVAA